MCVSDHVSLKLKQNFEKKKRDVRSKKDVNTVVVVWWCGLDLLLLDEGFYLWRAGKKSVVKQPGTMIENRHPFSYLTVKKL